MLAYLFGRGSKNADEAHLDESKDQACSYQGEDFQTINAENKVNAPSFRMTVLPSSPLRMDARSKGLFTALKKHGILMWEPQPNVLMLQAIGGSTEDFRIINLQPRFCFHHSKFEYLGDAFTFQDNKNRGVNSKEFLAWVRNKSSVRISAHRGTLVLYTTMKEWVMYINHTRHTIEFR